MIYAPSPYFENAADKRSPVNISLERNPRCALWGHPKEGLELTEVPKQLLSKEMRSINFSDHNLSSLKFMLHALSVERGTCQGIAFGILISCMLETWRVWLHIWMSHVTCSLIFLLNTQCGRAGWIRPALGLQSKTIKWQFYSANVTRFPSSVGDLHQTLQSFVVTRAYVETIPRVSANLQISWIWYASVPATQHMPGAFRVAHFEQVGKDKLWRLLQLCEKVYCRYHKKMTSLNSSP